MFTDNPVTPIRLETLLGVLQDCGQRSLPEDVVISLLQPGGLPGLRESSSGAKDTIKAAIELQLVRRDGDVLTLTERISRKQAIRDSVLEACDELVLGTADVENYLALFYSYMLGLGSEGVGRTRKDWVDGFNQTAFGGRTENPFNETKLGGINRWFSYLGLGWWEPNANGDFQCNPYHRLRRRLPDVFGRKRKLEDDEFMLRVAEVFPELDGGALFRKANPRYDAVAKQVTQGLADALLELHLDGILVLHGERDSDGWSLNVAAPPVDGTLRSERFDFVERKREES